MEGAIRHLELEHSDLEDGYTAADGELRCFPHCKMRGRYRRKQQQRCAAHCGTPLTCHAQHSGGCSTAAWVAFASIQRVESGASRCTPPVGPGQRVSAKRLRALLAAPACVRGEISDEGPRTAKMVFCRDGCWSFAQRRARAAGVTSGKFCVCVEVFAPLTSGAAPPATGGGSGGERRLAGGSDGTVAMGAAAAPEQRCPMPPHPPRPPRQPPSPHSRHILPPPLSPPASAQERAQGGVGCDKVWRGKGGGGLGGVSGEQHGVAAEGFAELTGELVCIAQMSSWPFEVQVVGRPSALPPAPAPAPAPAAPAAMTTKAKTQGAKPRGGRAGSGSGRPLARKAGSASSRQHRPAPTVACGTPRFTLGSGPLLRAELTSSARGQQRAAATTGAAAAAAAAAPPPLQRQPATQKRARRHQRGDATAHGSSHQRQRPTKSYGGASR